MSIIETSIMVNAPIELCFNCARDIGVHTQTVWRHTGERAVAGVTEGLIGEGEEVTFEARHLGVRQRLTSRITAFEYPIYFVDEMQRGAFRSLRHEHRFEQVATGTRMVDRLVFESPLGWVGRLFNRLVLERYMRRFIDDRNAALKQYIEGIHGGAREERDSR